MDTPVYPNRELFHLVSPCSQGFLANKVFLPVSAMPEVPDVGRDTDMPVEADEAEFSGSLLA